MNFHISVSSILLFAITLLSVKISLQKNFRSANQVNILKSATSQEFQEFSILSAPVEVRFLRNSFGYLQLYV